MTYTLSLEPAEVQLIANALAAMPYGRVALLVSKIMLEVQKQDQAAAPQAETP